MKIRTRSFFAFGLVVIFFLSSIVFINFTITNQNNRIIQIKNNELQSLSITTELQQILSNYQIQTLLGASGYDTVENSVQNKEILADQFRDELQKIKLLNSDESVQNLTLLFDQFTTGDVSAGEKITSLIATLRETYSQQIQSELDKSTSTTWLAFKQAMAFQGVSIVLVIILSVLFSRSIIRPINKLIEASEMIAGGKLTQSINLKSKDEFGQLARTFETMRMNLSRFVASSKDTSELVIQISDELTDSMKENEHSVNQMQQAIMKIEAGAHSQLHDIDDIVLSIQEILRAVKQVTSSTAIVAENSISSENNALHGKVSINQVDNQMINLQQTIQACSDSVKQLEIQSNSINELVYVIKNLAEQTNLVALNASIEAARAGEHGKGFTVVAEEIRKLAQQVSLSSNHIDEVVLKILGDLNTTVKQMEQGKHQTVEVNLSVKEAKSAFETIFEGVIKISNEMQEISAASQEMQAGTEQVEVTIKQLASIAQETYQEGSQAVEQSNYQYTLIRASGLHTERLNQAAEELQTRINVYNA
jgi:methyl-accepting chemotaxis protein